MPNNLTPEQVTVLEEILGKCDKLKKSVELVFHCPFHNRNEQEDPDAKKLSIHISGKWHCWHCHKRGKKDPLYIIKRFGARDHLVRFKGARSYLYDDDDGEVEQETRVILPDGYRLLMFKSTAPDFNACKRYLHSRGVSQKDIIFYKIGCYTAGRYKGRVVFPSFDDDGELNFFVGRKIEDSAFGGKYMNSRASKDIIFNELYIDWDDRVVLVEGPMDMLKCRNSIPLLGSTLRADSVLFDRIVSESSRVVVALDREVKAWDKANKIASMLYEHGIDVSVVDLRKEKKYGDMGDMTKEVAEEFIKGAKQYDPTRSALDRLM